MGESASVSVSPAHDCALETLWSYTYLLNVTACKHPKWPQVSSDTIRPNRGRPSRTHRIPTKSACRGGLGTRFACTLCCFRVFAGEKYVTATMKS